MSKYLASKTEHCDWLNLLLYSNKIFFFSLNNCLGTGIVAPLYAALTAQLMNLYGVSQIQKNFPNGGYYKYFVFNDITSGNNGYFSATSGWDPVTGMGSFSNYTLTGQYNSTCPTTNNVNLGLLIGFSVGFGIYLILVIVMLVVAVFLAIFGKRKSRANSKYVSEQNDRN